MTSPLLTDDDIALRLRSRPGWKRDGDALVKTYVRDNFNGAIAFVNAIAAAANAADHHPDIAVSWDEVTVRTWSHDAGGITDRDFRLAETIDRL